MSSNEVTTDTKWGGVLLGYVCIAIGLFGTLYLIRAVVLLAHMILCVIGRHMHRDVFFLGWMCLVSGGLWVTLGSFMDTSAPIVTLCLLNLVYYVAYVIHREAT